MTSIVKPVVTFAGKPPIDVLSYIVRVQCDRFTVSSADCFYSELTPDITIEKIKSSYTSAINEMGRYYSLKGHRSYHILIEGHKNGQIVTKAAFAMLLGGPKTVHTLAGG